MHLDMAATPGGPHGDSPDQRGGGGGAAAAGSLTQMRHQQRRLAPFRGRAGTWNSEQGPSANTRVATYHSQIARGHLGGGGRRRGLLSDGQQRRGSALATLNGASLSASNRHQQNSLQVFA